MGDPRHQQLRVLRADNPGTFTLDGTRVHVVGRDTPAVIDPGPADANHLRALVRALEGARSVTLLLTHGHGDHADAVEPLTRALVERGVGVTVRGAGTGGASDRQRRGGAAGEDEGPGPSERGAGPARGRPLEDGEAVTTEAGPLVAVRTPGHTPDHLAFHWPAAGALFAGDLLMGRGDTTWVAGYAGCVADYLDSLARVRSLDLAVIFPAHGPPLEDPADALDRFEAHRRHRIEQVRRARAERPGASARELLPAVYGDTIPEGLEAAALESLEAVLEYVENHSDEASP